MKKAQLLTSVMAVGWLCSVNALAQEAAANTAGTGAGASELGEIVVTARRRAEDVSKVPISISAFSQETLERKGVVNLSDVVKITPGLNITAGGGKASPFVTIRGQSKGVTGNIQPGVVTYVNEVPLPNSGSMIPAYDVQNIQVIKGPQGTLFGRNSMGGALLVSTNQPTYDFGGYAKITAGSYEFRQFEGALNVPIIEDVLALRLATQLYKDEGAVDAMRVTDYTIDPATLRATPGSLVPLKHKPDEFSGQAFRASLQFEPNDSIKNVTVYEYTKLRGAINSQFARFYPTGFNGGSPALYFLPSSVILGPAVAGRFGAAFAQNLLTLSQCGTIACDWRAVQNFYANSDGRTEILNSDPWDARTIIHGVSNTTTLSLGGNATLKNIFGYRNTDVYSNTDIDSTPLFITQTAQQTRIEQITEELQLSGTLLDGRLNYTLGGFYYKETPSGPGGTSGLEINSLFGLSHSQSVTYLTNESKALYGQIDYSLDSLLDGLTVTAGVRQTWDSVEGCAAAVTYSPTAPALAVRSARSSALLTEGQCNANSARTANFPGSVAVVAQRLPKRKFDSLTYTLGANWEITQDLMIYAARRKGYRGGSYNTPLFDQAFLGHLQTFEPETIQDWEAGAKLRWRAGGMQGSLDLAVFTGKDKNYQLAVGSSGLAGGVCVPEAITPTRPTNCGTINGTPGVRISHSSPTTIVNAGELTIKGFELATTVSPFDGLTIGAGVSHVDYSVDELTLDPNLLAALRAGNQFIPRTIVVAQQPRWTYNLDFNYAFPKEILGSQVSINANVKYNGSYTLGDIKVGSYTVGDARVTFAGIGGSRIDVSAFVKNLTDEDYNVGTVNSAAANLGGHSYIQAPPRTYGLEMKYAF